MPENESKTKSDIKLNFVDLLFTLVIPIFVGQITVLYFGTNYSATPGEGYGYGLAISILITIFAIARFLWKYRHHQEDETRP